MNNISMYFNEKLKQLSHRSPHGLIYYCVSGRMVKYTDNKWKVVPDRERFQLTKYEGQVRA